MSSFRNHLIRSAAPATLALVMLGCDVEQGKTVAEGDSAPAATAKDAETTAAAKTPIRNAEPADITATIGKPSLSPSGASGLTTSAEARAMQGPTPPAADRGAPQLDISFAPQKLDLGMMKPGVPKTGTVVLTNNGNATVQIKKAVASCGCTTPNWPRDPIGPGESAEIEITLKPSLKQGQKLNKRVTLQMVAGPPQVITVAGEVGMYVKLAPDFLDAAKQESADQGMVVLDSADETPFAIVAVDPPVLSGAGEEKSLHHELAMDWDAWEAAGRRPMIKLTTDHPNAPELSVTVRRAIIRDKPTPPQRGDIARSSKLLVATQGRNAEGVKAAIEAGDDIDAAGMGGMKALHWAAKNGDAEIMQLLLEAGADVNTRNKVGKTPVGIAAESGNLAALEMLVAKGGDIDSVDEIGGTPLLWAAALSKDPSTVAFLVEKGANVNIVDSNGMTPLIWAAGIGRPESVKVLVDQGADLDVVEMHQKENALMRAARIGSPESLEVLLAAGPDLEMTNLLGQSAVIIAASSAPVEKIKLLVDAGADLGVRDTRQWSVLDHAKARTDAARTEVLEYLVANAPASIKAAGG